MKQNTMKQITGWAIILVTLFSAYLIAYFKQFHVFFILLLLFEMVLVVRFRKIFSRNMIRTAQILLGLLFLFSGFVKAVDPLGTAYRVEDYFIAFGTEWMMRAALPLAFVLNTAELLLGGLLLLNLKPRFTAWYLMLMMLFFSLTTLNDALNNPVPDCGCFGDAVIMTNWQTLYKNLVIDVLVLIIFLNRNRIRRLFVNTTKWAVGFALIVLFIGFQYYNYTNLPLLDFRPWKEGKKMIVENPDPVRYYLTYQNKQTGETKEYLSPDYPYNDPEWLKNWEFVSQRVEDPNKIPGMDLAIIDFDGNDVTKAYLENPDYQFFVVAWDLTATHRKAFKQIDKLFENADDAGISMIVLTSTLQNKIKRFISEEKISPELPFYNADDIVLKTMVRANPGLILMKDGRVIKKWHYRNLPDWHTLENEYPDLAN